MICDALELDELTEEKFKKARDYFGCDSIIISYAWWLQNDYTLFCSPKNYMTNE